MGGGAGVGYGMDLIGDSERYARLVVALSRREKFATDTFTLDDFLKQMQQLKNMGSIKGMLGMLPGARGMRARRGYAKGKRGDARAAKTTFDGHVLSPTGPTR